MKSFFKVLSLFLFLLMFCDCAKEEMVEKDYPTVQTNPVINISDKGATFEGLVISSGNSEVTSHGFIWSTNDEVVPSLADKFEILGSPHSEVFAAEITSTLIKGVKYYVRAFVIAGQYTVYGNTVSFESLGSGEFSVSSILPLLGTTGDTIFISGSGFSSISNNNRVFFGELQCNILASNDSLIVASVPNLTENEYQITIRITGGEIIYEDPFIVTTPHIESISPLQAGVHDTIIIYGDNFSYLPNQNKLSIGNEVSSVVYSTKTYLHAVIPPNLDLENQVQLEIANKVSIFDGAFTFLEPEFQNMFPRYANFGDIITIEGSHFSPSPSQNIIKVGNVTANQVSSSRTEIQFFVPVSISNSRNLVSLQIGEKTYGLDSLHIYPPEITDVTPNNIVDFLTTQEITLYGRNINPVESKNILSLNGVLTNIISADSTFITFQIPNELFPDIYISTIDSVDIDLTVLDQNTTFENGIYVNYESRWTKLNDFPGQARSLATTFTINGKAYVGLGKNDDLLEWYNDMWEYDPETDSWKKMSDLPGYGRSRMATVVTDSKAYIVGGTRGYPFVGNNNLAEVWEFNPQSDSWTQKNDFPGGKRWAYIALNFENEVFVTGGIYADNINTVDKRLWSYDNENDSWTQVSNVDPFILITDNDFYGYGTKGYLLSSTTTSFRRLWEYDQPEDIWTELSPMPEPLAHSTGFILNDLMYGGTGSPNLEDGTDLFYSYSPSEDIWTEEIFRPASRWGASGFQLNGYGYILLGIDNGLPLRDFWRFNPLKPD